MVSSVYWEWELLLRAIKLGVKLAFVYDGIRMFRCLIPHRNLLISIEDFIFWMYATIIIFELQLEQSYGVMRGFVILGMLLGMYLYLWILGKRLFFLAEKGIGVFKRRLTGIIKVFKIGIRKQKDRLENNRSEHGKKKKTPKRKKTEQAGSIACGNGSSGNVGSGSSE